MKNNDYFQINKGVQKERMTAEDMFVKSLDGSDFITPHIKPYPHKPPKCSDCSPLFMKVINTSILSVYLLVNINFLCFG